MITITIHVPGAYVQHLVSYSFCIQDTGGALDAARSRPDAGQACICGAYLFTEDSHPQGNPCFYATQAMQVRPDLSKHTT
jgi:hypothetical protein